MKTSLIENIDKIKSKDVLLLEKKVQIFDLSKDFPTDLELLFLRGLVYLQNYFGFGIGD